MLEPQKKAQRVKRKYPTTIKLDKEEVPDLIKRFRNEPTSGTYKWVDRLSPEQARDELLERFRNFLLGFERILLTGKYNLRSSYQKNFLKTWANSSTPLDVIGLTLSKELAKICTEEDIKNIVASAFINALSTSTKNATAAFVTMLKDSIYPMVKGQNSNKCTSFEDYKVDSEQFEDSSAAIELDVFIETNFAPGEIYLIRKVMEGANIKLPESIKLKFYAYFPEFSQ